MVGGGRGDQPWCHKGRLVFNPACIFFGGGLIGVGDDGMSGSWLVAEQQNWELANQVGSA